VNGHVTDQNTQLVKT